MLAENRPTIVLLDILYLVTSDLTTSIFPVELRNILDQSKYAMLFSYSAEFEFNLVPYPVLITEKGPTIGRKFLIIGF